ncbi:MAG: hypothetical protein MMC23_008958 [Stictis urceolatum]|nr:hypothetical protein [Stictis urceolata]
MSGDHENLDDLLNQELVGLNQQVRERAQPERQKLGAFTVGALIMNRTIGNHVSLSYLAYMLIYTSGSGIFVTPRNVLLGTGSVGISLLLWAIGAVAAIGGLLVWLELGLSIPRHMVPDGRIKSVPRSGGEKNYLEYILKSPKFFTTCLFGIIFIVLGNLSGNGVQFGLYVMRAAGNESPSHDQVIACAVAALTIACVIHIFSRRGGIMLSNIFATFKVLVLIAIIIIGFSVGAGAKLGRGAHSETANLKITNSFAGPSNKVSSYSFSLLNILYSFSGFDQPFYVLSEGKQPRKNFPRATISAMSLAGALFFLVNAAYMCAIPVTPEFLVSGNDMTVLFFQHIFGPGLAPRVMAGVVAACIFGNIIVMTFTASRVKQEIAKEGILPFSLFFATGNTTPDAWLRRKLHERRVRKQRRSSGLPEMEDPAIALPEQTPMAALALHWVVSLVMLGVTAMLSSAVAYFVLVFVYSYVLVVLIPFLVTGGLLYLKFTPSSQWSSIQNFRPWGGPTAAIAYFIVCLFLLVTPFLDPGENSPWSYETTGVKWWILPTVGLSSLLWGPVWWACLRFNMWREGLELVVTRLPHIEQDEEDGEWVQRAELIDHVWQSRTYARKNAGGLMASRGSEEGSLRAVVVTEVGKQS